MVMLPLSKASGRTGADGGNTRWNHALGLDTRLGRALGLDTSLGRGPWG
jgi:hypothetical protein